MDMETGHHFQSVVCEIDATTLHAYKCLLTFIAPYKVVILFVGGVSQLFA